MATTNYGLADGKTTDDFLAASEWNQVPDTLDRILGALVRYFTMESVRTGWSIAAAKTVGAGAGWCGMAYCVTTEAQAITGLTNGALNYVFARADGTSPESGTVTFIASTSSTKTTGDLLLGTITLDGGGTVTAQSDSVDGDDRGFFGLKPREFTGSGSVASLAGSASVDVDIDHSSQGTMYVPGAIAVTITEENVTYACSKWYDDNGFTITFANGNAYAVSVTYSWTRKGLAA